jgi:hypothetical protein
MENEEIDLDKVLNELDYTHRTLGLFGVHSTVQDTMPLLIQTVKELIDTKQQVQELQKALNERK